LPRELPKLLYPIAGAPILAYPLLSLLRAPLKLVVLVTSDYTHRAVSDLMDLLSRRPERSVARVRVVKANAPGTAQAVMAARRFVDGPFLYTNGDVIYDPTLVPRLMSRFVQSDCSALVTGSARNRAPTHPHFIVGRGRRLTKVELYPEFSAHALCSLETAVLQPDLFDYLSALPHGAMTMAAVAKAVTSGYRVKVMRYSRFWYHLAEPRDLLVSPRDRTAIRSIHQSLDLRLL
jgi:NDP-sugar pyrophosphorylase family protein